MPAACPLPLPGRRPRALGLAPARDHAREEPAALLRPEAEAQTGSARLFVGEPASARLRAALAAHRLVTVAGPGGVGQTLLGDERLGTRRRAPQAVPLTRGPEAFPMAQLNWTGACALDPWTLQQVLSEMTDPVLQRQGLALRLATVEADEQVSGDERTPPAAAAQQSGQHRLQQQPSASCRAAAMAV